MVLVGGNIASIYLLILFLWIAPFRWVKGQGERTLMEEQNKKIEKILKKSWKTDAYKLSALDFHTTGLGDEHTRKEFYRFLSQHGDSAYLVLSSAKGRYDYFDYMVQLSPDLHILQVNILEYRSEYGYEITNKRWLGQFRGQTGCEIEYGRDIDAISGATLSATSITADIRKICELLHLN